MMADSFHSDVITQEVQTGEIDLTRLDARQIPLRALPWLPNAVADAVHAKIHQPRS